MEATKDIAGNIELIRKRGLKVGLAINPETDVESIKPYLKDIDMALVMTVHPGFGGQSYIHECTEKIEKLATFIRNFDLKLKVSKDEVHPKEIQKLLVAIQDTEAEALVSRLALRSMKQAKYTVDCTGHFGLAAQYYCHFTSPIRRYPDLQIHRIIKDHIRGRMKRDKKEHYDAILNDIAAQCSKMERRAEEAERETIKLKKCQYMEDRLGEVFEGVVSGVTEWGIYVELPNTVEGLVHVSKLPGDFFVYDEAKYEMKGTKRGLVYSLGQSVKVVVDSVDEITRTIDFSIYESDEE